MESGELRRISRQGTGFCSVRREARGSARARSKEPKKPVCCRQAQGQTAGRIARLPHAYLQRFCLFERTSFSKRVGIKWQRSLRGAPGFAWQPPANTFHTENKFKKTLTSVSISDNFVLTSKCRFPAACNRSRCITTTATMFSHEKVRQSNRQARCFGAWVGGWGLRRFIYGSYAVGYCRSFALIPLSTGLGAC